MSYNEEQSKSENEGGGREASWEEWLQLSDETQNSGMGHLRAQWAKVEQEIQVQTRQN